ncbi:hypothetical protein HPB51_026910 [Rhipicephalus microplus]|uniref:Uncharacterized protein n=1 Tax=Rhipicephalus microplus TaxID=6941 RepID=A0A9J6D1L0_RHIMP|nr:hypothetical protein HPB51_026910 [Rhipicephalus microplus]
MSLPNAPSYLSKKAPHPRPPRKWKNSAVESTISKKTAAPCVDGEVTDSGSSMDLPADYETEGHHQAAPFCLAGCKQCSAFTCSWPVTGPCPCLDNLLFLLEDFRDTPTLCGPRSDPRLALQVPSKVRNGAALTLTRRACTSAMQRPAQHSTPTTTDALSQQAAFLNSAHGTATCNAGGVSATPSLIATQTPEPESRNAALALQSTTPTALPTVSASGLPIGNSESVDKRVSTSIVPSIAEVLPSITSAVDSSTEMDFTEPQVNEDNTSSTEGSWNTVSANRKPASTARPHSKLITVGIQLPPGTLTPKLPLYDLLSTIIATTNLSPKTSVEVTLQAKPAQSLVFLKTHLPLTAHLLLSLTSVERNGKLITLKPYAPSPPISRLGVIHNVGGRFTPPQLLHDLESFTSDILAARMMGSTESVFITFAGTGTVLINAPNTAFRPSAAAVRLLYQQIPMLTFATNLGASISKSTPTHLPTPPAPTF